MAGRAVGIVANQRIRTKSPRGELQIARLNVGGNFANAEIAAGQRSVECFCSIEVSAGGTDYPEVQHRQCAAQRRERRRRVFYERIS